MSSGAVAAIMNPIGSMVIEQLGWRAGYRFFGLLFLLMTLPATIFWLRLRPRTAEPPSGGSSLSGFQGNVWRTIRQPGFLLLIVITGVANLLTCYSQMLSSYGTAIGLTASACAMLLSLSMVGNVLLKLLLGAIVVTGGITAIGCALGKTSIYFYPVIKLPVWDPLMLLSFVSFCVLQALPLILDITGERKWQ